MKTTNRPDNMNLETRTEPTEARTNELRFEERHLLPKGWLPAVQECLPLEIDGGFPIARLCSWCGKDMPVIATDRLPFKVVSHGICAACVARLEAELE
jgi:hypothetical protein